jgi:phospholipase/carboxylesterase
MLHGHLGNEEVMWIFAQTLPPDWLVIAPRAIIPVSENSYTWLPRTENEWPSLEQFGGAVSAVTHFIHALPKLYHADRNRIYLMGFSQGAAVAFATAISQPGWIKGIASLVGFMPLGVESAVTKAALSNLPVFMAVGTQDERIPLAVAQASAEAARAMGAFLEYREYETGHKLNAEGMRKLKNWWAERIQFG